MQLRHRLGLACASDGGSALPLGLLVLLVLTMLAMSMVAVATTDLSIATNWKSYNDAFYAAQAGIDAGVVNLRALLQTTPQPTLAQLAALPAPTLSTSRATFSRYSVSALSAVPYQTNFKTGAYTGLVGLVSDYAINAQTAMQDGSAANVTQVYKFVQVPLFQFGVFYGKGVDLEIAPGPPMTITGRVHANSNIYVGAGSTLKFDSAVTTAGTINRGIKRDSSIPWGNDPQVIDMNGNFQALNFDHTYQPGFTGAWATTQQWANAAKGLFGNNVQDSAMGVGQIVPPGDPALFDPNVSNPDVLAHQLIEVPKPGDSAAGASARLYNEAGLRIVDGVATDASGAAVAVPDGLITTKSFYDAREAKMMTVTEVDMSVLNSSTLAQAGGPLYKNGILYVAQSATSGGGVRLVKGSTLPSSGGGGLTVASPNPLYIEGDYNTTNKVPAAVMADAITVLSNNWAANNSDLKGSETTDQRPASTTTVNAAFATGPSAESTLNDGNGQLENSIRFLEDWSGQTINYTGSLVELWHSMEAKGAWRCCGTAPGQYYTAPSRNWAYDTSFSTTPPPGTPMGVVLVKGPWSRQ